MRRLFLLLIITLMQFSFANITIKGHVDNASGKIAVNAHAHIAPVDGDVYNPLVSSELDSRGNFIFKLDDGKYYDLLVTAADHIAFQVPIITDEKNAIIDVNIRLEANQYPEEFNDVKIIGDWNGFKFSSADDMQKQPDGTFTYDLTTDKDKVAYQLINVDVNGHSINGTMNDALEYDGGGDYRSIVKVKDGRIHIVFDPSKLIRVKNDNLPKVNFQNNETLNTIAAIKQFSQNERNKYYQARSAYSQDHKSTEGFKYDFSNLADYLLNEMKSNNALIRRYAAVRYVSTVNQDYNENNLTKIVELLPVEDPLWALNPYSLREVYAK